jgi:hypothetical protein
MITGARFSQEGSFRLSEAQERWGPFHATHMVTIHPPAFDWDARIRWAPGLTMFVRDAYGAGTGTLHAAAFGLLPVVDQRGTPELAQGELMRYLAEAVWYPTALLPSQGVRWEPIDEARARPSPTAIPACPWSFASIRRGSSRPSGLRHALATSTGSRYRPPGKRRCARMRFAQACGFRWKARSRGTCPEGPCRTGAAASGRSPMSWRDRCGVLGHDGAGLAIRGRAMPAGLCRTPRDVPLRTSPVIPPSSTPL